MKNKSLFLLLFSTFLSLYSVAQERLWNDLSPTGTELAQRRLPASPWPGKYRLVKLNSAIAKQLQQLAPMENAQAPFPVVAVPFGIPLPEGGLHADIISESPVLSPDLQKQYPSIRTYLLRDEKSKRFSGRITITPDGVNGLIFTDSGAAWICRVPEYGADAHIVYYVKDIELPVPLRCTVEEEMKAMGPARVNGAITPLAGDCQLRTYRVAISATGEFTQWAGSVNNAVASITGTINAVSAIYERDATIRFILVNNTNVIYTDPGSDPFPTVTFPDLNTLNTNHSTLVSVIGNSNFDVGMVFSRGWDGGLARLNSACVNSGKGGNAAGLSFGSGPNPVPGPQGPVFIGTVAHEIAHQFSATHSFSASNGQCGSNASESSAWETGGGSTIMAYAGSCTGNSYQNNSDLYFHGGSIGQITNFAVNSATCATIAGTSNSAPVVSVSSDSYMIPPGTPFELIASASDASSHLLYCWEQMDAGPLTSSRPSSSAISGPLFRSFPPNENPGRVFPSMEVILGTYASVYEVLPTVARSMKFRVTVRDGAPGGGCTGEANLTVTTAGSTPFQVTSQNNATSWTANGSNTATISWNPGNTADAPLNCNSVNILFSTNGGFTYPYTLATGIPNNGSANIIIPNLATNSGRIRVQAAGNIFFDINNADITITTACTAFGAMIAPGDAVSANAGDPSLNLDLNPTFGTAISNFTGQLTTADPKTSLVFNNAVAGLCQSSGNVYQYHRHRFMVNRAGNYTFTIPSATYPAVMNLYQHSYEPTSLCTNFLNSNGTRSVSSVNIVNSFTQTLSPGIYYELTVGTFNTNFPVLPLNYTISFSNDAGGSLYTNYPSPGAGFSYTYVIVNNATGAIKAFDAGSDLSNATNYPPGSYSVYGLSYRNTITPSMLNNYAGGSFDAFKLAILNNPGTICSNLSINAVQVIVKGDGPPPLLPLSAFLSNNSVLLKWGTSSEKDVSHFEIHRSTDGNNFQKLPGQVNAKGNSTTQTDYTYTDNSPADGINYYRVRQMNLDAQEVMSSIARAERIDADIRLRLRPNPVQDQPLLLEYLAEEREELRIVITDSKGTVMMKKEVTAKTGMNQFRFEMQQLAKGLYFLTVNRDAGTIATRFIKQ